jgi:hypothetical protein
VGPRGRRAGDGRLAAAEPGHPPLVEQVAVVDAHGSVGPVTHDGEGPAVGAGQQRAGHRVGEGAATGGLAQRPGGGQGLGPVPGVEVVDAQRPQRAGHRAAPGGGIVLGPAGGVHAAEGGEGLGGGGAELDGLLGQDRVHRVVPSRALATIMRWTSMVPDATVAAWA